MGWCTQAAMKAYLDTLKLCKEDHERQCCSFWNPGLHSSELISAMAAGGNSQLIIEICNGVASSSTIALAAAARHTGGHFICILSDPETLPHSLQRMKAIDLLDDVEFLVGDGKELICQYKNIDFALIDCNNEKSLMLFELLNLNPAGAMVTAKNIFKRIPYLRNFANSRTQHFGNGLQVTRIMSCAQGGGSERKQAPEIGHKRGHITSHVSKGRWIVEIDKKTGEEHVFRIRPRKDKPLYM